MTIDFTVIFNLMGSLAIFLFAIEYLADALKNLDLENLKKWLLYSSKTPTRGLITGAITTTLLDSSSVVIIFLITFVDAGLISFSNSLGIVLGANIGTTISSQIIAFQIGDYAALPLIVAVFTKLLVSSKKAQWMCQFVIGVSLIFFSLHLMNLSVLPYKNSAELQSWMAGLNNPYTGVLIGAFITLIIQSSSATVAIAITLASQGMMSLDAGIAIMLGSEIGTCSDTLLATIGRSREAVRIGMFHLFYNIFAVIMGLITFAWLKGFVVWVDGGGANTARMIANAHVAFNVGGALIFLLLIPVCRKILLLTLPQKPAKLTPKILAQ